MERVCVEPPVLLDRSCGVPLTSQLSGQLRAAMCEGRIGAGDRLPSTRALAVALGVSRTVVTDAYAQLYAEGWLEGRHGSGTFVAAGAAGAAGTCRADAAGRGGVGTAGYVTGPWAGTAAVSGRPAGADGHRAAGETAGGYGMAVHAAAARPAVPGRAGPGRQADEGRRDGRRDGVALAVRARWAADPAGHSADHVTWPLIDLQPGVPWAAGIDRSAWRRAWRQAGAAEPAPQPRPVADPAGLPELRAVLAGYLRRSRGVGASPGEIIVTRGIANGLDLIAASLLRPGDAAGIEEPGWPAARSILAARGARIVPCPVDEHGLVPAALPPGLRLIHTTPAHQTPLGGRLPVPRRQALLAWARQTGALIVEDDYDSEFRYDVAPLPALQSLDPGVVAYLGTTAKTLTPELSVGWLVAPPDVRALVAATRQSLADRTPAAVQHATASLIKDGYLERHIRRVRPEYARRRSAITGILAGLPPPARLLGDTAGMHVVLELPPAVTGAAAVAARDRGIAVATLDHYVSVAATQRVHGLVIGYGAATLPAVRRGCEALREIVEPLLRPV